MTLLEGVNRVKFRSHRGDQSITTDQLTADIVMCFNLALAEMATKLPRQAFRAEVTIPTVQGTEIYSVATGTSYPIQELMAAHYLFNGTSYNLKKIESELEFWGQYYVQNTSQNRPYIYCPWGLDASKNKQVRLFPIPDAVYSIVFPYQLDPTAVILTTTNLATELPLLQPYLQKAWITGALHFFLDSFDDPKADGMYAKFMKEIVDQDSAEEADLDGSLQFRIETGRTRFVDPATGVRLQ